MQAISTVLAAGGTTPYVLGGLSHARAIGEFGAVYVVSGHIAGETDTMPLRVEKLFQEYNNPGSFAVASVLALIALGTLLLGKLALTHLEPPEQPESEYSQ